MSTRDLVAEFVTAFAIALVAGSLVKLLWNFIWHRESIVDWETSSSFAILLGIILTWIKSREIKEIIPPPRPKVVLRPRLIERLNQGMGGKVLLLSASAGFSKTTLVGDWIAGCGLPAAWLSLDEGDSKITRFLVYLVAALQRVSTHPGWQH